MNKEIIKKIIGVNNVVIYDGIDEWFDEFPFFEFLKAIHTTKYQKKNLIHSIITSFDIETTRVDELSFCYIWQFDIYMNGTHHIILDRALRNIDRVFTKLWHATSTKDNALLICGVHNLAYEFQFCKNLLDWENVFAKENRKPITATANGVYFIDTYQISHKALSKVGKEVGVRKLTEKFDYSIVRTSNTTMNDEEYAYCCNDVIIPTLYIQQLIDDYLIPEKFLPVTQTSKIRHIMKQQFKTTYMGAWRDTAEWLGDNLYPETFEEYKNDMKYLFRGAWTHGNPKHVGELLKEVDSYDITSSYIYTMFTDLFPMSKFKDTELRPEEIDTNTTAFKGVFIFYNIQSKNNIAYESVHKVSAKGVINDNGKVYYAKEMKAYLTDVDFELYKNHYDWESYECFDLQISKKARLPRYVIGPMINAYLDKQRKKMNHESYITEKELVNSSYGMMVTKIPLTESKVVGTRWVTEERDDPYSDRYRSFLSPYWGIWVTAYSRKHLFDGIDCYDTFYYSDTDSIKGHVSAETMEKLNRQIFENVKKSKEFYNIDNELVDDLGQWDYEGRIKLFKYLGAKRYICYKDGKTTATIAGCPKSEYINHYSGHMFAKQFHEFTNNFSLKSVKLRSLYNDKTYQIEVDGCQQEIYGCNTLLPTDFTLSMAGVYIEFIKWLKNKKMEGKDYV